MSPGATGERAATCPHRRPCLPSRQRRSTPTSLSSPGSGPTPPPATDVFRREEIDLPRIMLEHQGHRDVVRNAGGRPPDMRTVIIDIARLAGARAASKTALPGTKKVFQGLERLNRAAKVRNAIEEIRERMGKQTETSVEP